MTAKAKASGKETIKKGASAKSHGKKGAGKTNGPESTRQT